MDCCYFAIGLMSGTSADGIDASLIKTDGDNRIEFVADYHLPYSAEFQAQLKQLLMFKKDDVINWHRFDRELTKLHADCVEALLNRCSVSVRSLIRVIGFHGQTIFHSPADNFTWQIGDPNLLARLCRIDVVADFRRRDMAYGGQGAPLVPIYHKALMAQQQQQQQQQEKPMVVLNIGGVANLTYIDDDENHLIAFDTGPGNALIDDLANRLFGLPFDENGNRASKGCIDHEFVQRVIESDEYFRKAPPKSLDRNHFNYILEDLINNNNSNQQTKLNNSAEDKMATISYLTSKIIYESIKRHLPQIRSIFVCGGGAKNEFIMRSLRECFEDEKESFKVARIDDLKESLNPDFIESQAFAYLAVRHLKRLPSTFPGTTGTQMPVTAGAYYPFV